LHYLHQNVWMTTDTSLGLRLHHYVWQEVIILTVIRLWIKHLWSRTLQGNSLRYIQPTDITIPQTVRKSIFGFRLSSTAPSATLAACRSSDNVQNVYSNVSYFQWYSAAISGRTLSTVFWRSTAILVASGLRCTTNIQTFGWQFINFIFCCWAYCMELFTGRISSHIHLQLVL